MVSNGRLLIFEERNLMNFEELLFFDFKGKSENFAKYLTQTPVVSNDMPLANFMFSTRNYIVLCSMDKESGCVITKGKSLPQTELLSKLIHFFRLSKNFYKHLKLRSSILTVKILIVFNWLIAQNVQQDSKKCFFNAKRSLFIFWVTIYTRVKRGQKYIYIGELHVDWLYLFFIQ